MVEIYCLTLDLFTVSLLTSKLGTYTSIVLPNSPVVDDFDLRTVLS